MVWMQHGAGALLTEQAREVTIPAVAAPQKKTNAKKSTLLLVRAYPQWDREEIPTTDVAAMRSRRVQCDPGSSPSRLRIGAI
jgi:hypothetical protein